MVTEPGLVEKREKIVETVMCLTTSPALRIEECFDDVSVDAWDEDLGENVDQSVPWSHEDETHDFVGDLLPQSNHFTQKW